jgi:hypothetical protein
VLTRTQSGYRLTGALPGLPTTTYPPYESLDRRCEFAPPGLLNAQASSGPFFTGIAGPYTPLVYTTANNLQSLVGGWLADPFPFVRQVVANQMTYGQTIATALQTGVFQPVTAIPGHITQNLANVVGTLTNTGVASLVVQSLTVPTDATLDKAAGLSSVLPPAC